MSLLLVNVMILFLYLSLRPIIRFTILASVILAGSDHD